VFGSDTAAKFYESISQDPLQRITGLFARIVEKTNRPVCVLIDDLDRCPADYVVDLLEGIQTSFRHKSVAYIVAADRSWLKASFEAALRRRLRQRGRQRGPAAWLSFP
jgi:hypothetical protein